MSLIADHDVEIVALFMSGRTAAQISIALGWGETMIWGRLHHHGLGRFDGGAHARKLLSEQRIRQERALLALLRRHAFFDKLYPPFPAQRVLQ